MKPPGHTATMSPRLGLILPDLAAVGDDGRLAADVGPGRLVNALAERWPNLLVCLPVVRKDQAHTDVQLGLTTERIRRLPPLHSTIVAQWYYRPVRKVIRQIASESDVLLIKAPFQLPACLTGLKQPKVLHVVANQVEVVRASTDYRGPLKILAMAYAWHQQSVLRRLVREPKTRTVTHGREMWELLGCRNGCTLVSSSLSRGEIRPRSDFTLHDPPRLLFVGYLRPEKGVDTLLHAFARLARQRPLQLTLTGGTDRDTSTMQFVRGQIRQAGLNNRVTVTNRVPFGPELFELYASHDIFVLPSLSEGTPRALVEARAFGCAAVASRVGGVPDSVQDGEDGLLVPPGDVGALESAIARLLDDEELRHRIAANGQQRAADFTVERFADTLVNQLHLALESSRTVPCA